MKLDTKEPKETDRGGCWSFMVVLILGAATLAVATAVANWRGNGAAW